MSTFSARAICARVCTYTIWVYIHTCSVAGTTSAACRVSAWPAGNLVVCVRKSGKLAI